ncbi:HNH endonuclease signature motif containing protein [Methanoculleus sp. UBA208]|uniref:HNH endonuclease signature motif containing protein n=1 Tax=Methanoculleus sp. UBA208 TaxID=1915494 RepID=UPI0025D6F2FF|nr:HNH endonuclease signature motif containing protein [Methanoculleus sp. UBA208]
MAPSIFDDRTDAERTRQALTSAKQRRIKEAVGSKCELCGKKYPLRNLKIHHIVEVHTASGSKDLNSPGNLLVLCSICHDDVHHKPVPKTKQKEIVRKRSEHIKKEISAILRDRAKINSTSGTSGVLKTPRIAPAKIKPLDVDFPDMLGSSSSKRKTRKKRDDDWSMW